MQRFRSYNKSTNSDRRLHDELPASVISERPTRLKQVNSTSPQPRSILKPSPPPLFKRASTSTAVVNRPRAASDIRHYAKNQAYNAKARTRQDQTEVEEKMRKRMNDILRFENARREQLRRLEILEEYSKSLDKYSLRALSRRLQVEDYYGR